MFEPVFKKAELAPKRFGLVSVRFEPILLRLDKAFELQLIFDLTNSVITKFCD